MAVMAVMLISTLSLMAQGRISGKVLDKQSGEPLSYAQVSLHKVSDTSLVNGAVTGDNGAFALDKVAFGTYLVKISYMGYETYFLPQRVTLSQSQNAINLGKIRIAPSAATLEAVQISAERTMVEYQLDKRVVNVDKTLPVLSSIELTNNGLL